MPKIAFISKNFNTSTERVIQQASDIIEEYQADGFSLTLRQLYYQFVARDLLPNKQKSYNRLGRIISDARLTGAIDWNAIEDRTRHLRGNSHWDNPAEIIEGAAESYKINMWENQPVHIEVWIEKDALVGVLDKVCKELDLDFFSCRGYVSQSEMFSAGRRLGRLNYLYDRKPIVLHLGDHDPSGIDMTRDIELRLNDFAVKPEDRVYRGYDPDEWVDPDMVHYFRENAWPIEVKRIALSMEQIRELNPPPNPAKLTDSRFEEYQKKYGSKSWELDALEPRYIENLIRETVKEYRDEEQWKADKKRWVRDRITLEKISQRFDDVNEFLNQ